MALIVLTSASGAPGVTTTAVGLALTWQRPVILVDADPGAYQAVLAGYLRGEISTGKGLQRVAEAHRDRRPLAEVVSDETVPLTAEAPGAVDGGAGPASRGEQPAASERSSTQQPVGPARRLLPGFARPANAGLFGPVWPDLAETFVRFEDAGIDVIVDAGRMDAQGVPQPLVDRADLVVLMTRTNLRSVAAARNYAAQLREQGRLTGGEANLGLILVGENQPYGRREIGKLLGMPVVAVVADDPENAAAFSDGARRSRKFDRSPLVKSLHHAVDDLTGHIRRRRVRFGLDEQVGTDETLEPDHSTGPEERDPAQAPPGGSAPPDPVPAASAVRAWIQGTTGGGGAHA